MQQPGCSQRCPLGGHPPGCGHRRSLARGCVGGQGGRCPAVGRSGRAQLPGCCSGRCRGAAASTRCWCTPARLPAGPLDFGAWAMLPLPHLAPPVRLQVPAASGVEAGRTGAHPTAGRVHCSTAQHRTKRNAAACPAPLLRAAPLLHPSQAHHLTACTSRGTQRSSSGHQHRVRQQRWRQLLAPLERGGHSRLCLAGHMLGTAQGSTSAAHSPQVLIQVQ